MTSVNISVIDAAEQLGTNKQHLFKVMKRLGIESVKEKSSATHGQKVSYITPEDYELLENELSGNSRSSGTEAPSPSAYGYFYLIQLEPEHDPGRFKLGFATSVEERIRSHRTAAPLCKLIKAWPCKLLWEKTAIDAITVGCEKLYTEVFRTNDMNNVESRCNSFFALMPSLQE